MILPQLLANVSKLYAVKPRGNRPNKKSGGGRLFFVVTVHKYFEFFTGFVAQAMLEQGIY